MNFAIGCADLSEFFANNCTKTVVPLGDFSWPNEETATVVTTSASKPIPSANAVFQEEQDRRLDQIKAWLKEIEDARAKWKQALIDGHDAEGASQRHVIKTLQSRINETIDKGYTERLNVRQLMTGQYGTLDGTVVHVLQVLDKSTGSFLAIPIDDQGIAKGLRFTGMDLRSIVDGNNHRLGDGIVFHVVGTETYKTVNGGSNTTFVLAAAGNTKDLRDGLSGYRQQDVKPPKLSDEEQSIIAKRSNERAAKEKLRLAKTFIKKGDRETARRWLESVILLGETSSTNEARRLLKALAQ